MAQKRYMDPDKVRVISLGFKTAASVLKVVSSVLEIQITILKTTAFMGMVGGAAVEMYLETIKPQIDDLGKLCEQIGGDVDNSIRLWTLAQQDG